MKSQNSKYVIALVVLVIILIGAGVYAFRLKKSNEELMMKIPPTQAQEEADIATIVPYVSKYMVLPDEKPTIATVVDKEKLNKSQPFFKDAENGDKILVFQNARKVLLYRNHGTGSGKVINFDVFVINPPANQQQGNVKPLPVEIRNGAGNAQLAAAVEKQLKDAAGSTVLTSVSDAKSSDYKGILVVDPSGKNAQSAQEVATFLKGQVGAMPRGETAPQGDGLVIFVGAGTQ